MTTFKQNGLMLGRRGFLAGSAALAATGLTMRGALAQSLDDPASLRRPGGAVVHMRAWERYPASDIPGLNAFLDANPDLSIEWASAPFARYRDRLIAEFIGGTPLDVIQVPETELAAWADSEWLMPLDAFEGAADILARATPAAADASRGADGRIYALPAFSDAFGLAYNVETFNAAGFERPGATLDELRAQMETIKADGLDEYPLSLGMGRQAGQFWSLWATLYASGGDMFDAEGQPAFDAPGHPLRDILEWYVAAYNDWRIVGLEDLQHDWGTVRTNIRSGAVTAGYMAQYALTEFNARPDSAVTGKIKIALVPGLEGNDIGTVGYAHGVGIAANTSDPDIAWRTLHAYAGPGEDGSWALTEARAMDQGGRCPFPEVYESGQLQALIQQITLEDAEEFNRLSEISRAKQGLKAPWYPEWEQGFMTQVQEALLTTTTVEAAISTSADLARRLAG